MSNCIFCKLASDMKETHIAETKHLFAVYDTFPASPGHALIMPKRHIVTAFEMNKEESTELTDILNKVKAQIETKHRPKAYNIGSNNGHEAGQVVMHLHIHVIPRYKGGHGMQLLGKGEKE